MVRKMVSRSSGRGEVGLLDKDDREDDRGESARPEPAEEAEVGRRAPDPSMAMATGTMRTSVRLSSDRPPPARSGGRASARASRRRTGSASSRRARHPTPRGSASPRRDPAPGAAVDSAADERGDEPAAAERDRQPVGQPGRGDGMAWSQLSSTSRRPTPTRIAAAPASPAATPPTNTEADLRDDDADRVAGRRRCLPPPRRSRWR